MNQIITLNVENTPELKIAKNFLIISILLYFLNGGISLFLPHITFWWTLSWLLSALFLTLNISGFYKLSKLGRNQNLFKYYMLLIISTAIFTLISMIGFKLFFGIWVLNINDLEPTLLSNSKDNFIFLGGLFIVGLFYIAFNIYWGYKMSLELSILSKDDFFIKGFKIILVSILIAIFANILFSLNATISSLLFTISMLGIIIGILIFISGFFRLKQISYKIS
ncbi:hypothetical protein [Helicobacter sp. 13S00477-4]|uniref:hypothetical protein n=1 Tax=Helicobacter sp. 13S00477-4 TaxID=1905759 RepID=UPI000BA70630|nr:hypothetical protein [Helicobacter sp. 13S00477-4]PAF51596.1 hypothetical protein BKH44_05115 [Helicobacter sp. 13S00477-4]